MPLLVSSIHQLAELIQQQASHERPAIVAVTGFGGSGKSTLAKQLSEELPGSVVIALDDFITNQLAESSADWDGFDWERLINQVLKPIKQGAQEISYDVYDWPSNQLSGKKSFQVEKYVILEGVGLIRDQLDDYFDYTVWLDVPLAVASGRGKWRDREVYGVDHDRLWDELWTKNDARYYEKYQPHQRADCVLRIEPRKE